MSLLSLEFLALALATALALAVLRGPLRAAAFFAANAWFASSHLDGTGIVFTALFCLAGFGAAQLVARRPRLTPYAVAVLVAVFLYARRYTFVELLVPERFLTTALSTAGLSFLLFKILHVVIDSASGRLGELSLARYANYCLAFTTFLMGPIQRYQDFSAQWVGKVEALPPRFEAHLDACNRVLRGLVKKFVVAELIHPWALSGALDFAALPAPELLGRTYAFYFFLYFDFSGYCDIVIGVGSLCGIRPPENFYLPFLSPNIAQFWLRVHRSLTLWLTDYIFHPLYLNLLRRPFFASRALLASCCAIFVTMLGSGLWHGTTIAFLLFGVVHGIYLVGFRIWEALLERWLGRKRAREWRESRTSRVLGVLLTFNLTALAYLFFVADRDDLAVLAGRFLLP